MPATNSRFARRGPRLWVWAAFMLGAFTATHTPASAMPVFTSWINDKAQHVAAFALLGVVTFWMATVAPTHSLRTAAASAVGLMLYAAADEWTQPWVGRTCEWSDWLADGVGAWAGAFSARWWFRRRHSGHAAEPPESVG